MDASTLTSAEERELAALRRRAYGPDADIASDPDALARLELLEAVVHPAVDESVREAVEADADVAGFDPIDADADADADPDADEDAVPALVEPPDDDAAAAFRERELDERRRSMALLRRVPIWAWVATAVAVLVVGTVVWGVGRLTEPRADLSLGRIVTDDRRPAGLDSRYPAGMYDLPLDELQQYESHRSLLVWSAINPEGVRCLFVQAPQFDSGILDSCVPANLDPGIDLPIWPGLPAEIVGDLPQGSVLRFVLHGDRVYVWERTAPASAVE